ncbi:MAG: histidine kinase [Ferruginibacter sp.]
MKRFLLHAGFWITYMLIFAWISFLWDRATMPQFSIEQLITIDLKGSFISFFPQAFFSYYLVYVAIPGMVKKKVKFIYHIVVLFIILFLCILINRGITNYIELPYLYHGAIKPAFLFEPRRIISTLLFFAFSSGLMLAIKMVRTQLTAGETEKELIKQKLETELKFLRNQINPHFLMNTLNNIYALARKKSDETAEVVMRLSELLRFVLYESNSQFISLNQEISLLDDYLALESIRYNKRLSVHFSKDIDSGNYQITPLLLLPFIENAFKHGISETRFESYISVELKVHNGYLNLSVENTNDHEDSTIPVSNIGLKNVKRQLELSYSDYRLDINDGSYFFEIDLFINLNSHVEI